MPDGFGEAGIAGVKQAEELRDRRQRNARFIEEIRLFKRLRRRAAKRDGATIHDQQSLRVVEKQGEIVRDEHDLRLAGFVQAAQRAQKAASVRAIHAGGRLIKHGDFRPQAQRHGEAKLALLAAA